MKRIAWLLLLTLLPQPVFAARYTLDKTPSSISFAGKHAGKDFTGSFGEWTADIEFDPDNLAASKISATIDTTSIHTGNTMYDGTLPTDDWFDTAKYPKATFEGTEISKNADGSYTAKGKLTIRDVTQEISLPFTLTPADLSEPQIMAKAHLTLDRITYNLGVRSDAGAEWVDRNIELSITVVATKQP